MRSPCFQVMTLRRHGLPAHGHDAFLVALADHRDEPGVEMELFEAQLAEFGQAQPRGVGQFADGLVTQIPRRRLRWQFEQAGDFVVGE